ncbi:MAG: DUF4397 domain-containing protein, partial [Acidobacteriota bacterium]
VACARESTRKEPVTSTPDTGVPSTSPPAAEVAKRDKALVRVVHAIPDTEADVFAGDKKEFTNVSYKTVTPYKELPDDMQIFSVKPAGQETAQPLAENRENLAEGSHYTVIALPGDENKTADLHVLNDNLTPPSTGKAKVRVVNASPGIKEIDVYAQGKQDALFSGLNFQSESMYSEIDPMTTALEVRTAGQKNVALTIPDVKFEAGKIYTVTVIGRTNKAPKLEAILVEDKLEGSQTQPSSGY